MLAQKHRFRIEWLILTAGEGFRLGRQRVIRAAQFLVSFLAVALGFSVLMSSPWAQASEYVKTCENRDPGEWNFGSSPFGCDADQYGDISRIEFIYGDYIFDRRATDREHRKEYTTNMHALIRQMAQSYIRSRKPDVSRDEVRAWEHALLAVATQETYMSHYRIGPDSRFKLTTGDRQDSHGMMQVNQKYHAARDQDSSFDLVGNITTAMDIYYLEWERAKKSSCYRALAKKKGVSRKQLFEYQARGAYSAYNGGSSAICRYANPRHLWVKNDIGFYDKWTTQEWNNFISDPEKKVDLNIKCLIDGDDLCAVAKEYQGQYLKNRPVVFENGRTCISGDGQHFDCTASLRIFSCMANITPEALEAHPVYVKDLVSGVTYTNHASRDFICRSSVIGLVAVGDFISPRKEIRLRADVGGRVVGSVKPHQVYQVLDYDVQLGADSKRYYRVRVDSKTEGYFYAGDEKDHKEWAVKAEASLRNTKLYLPKAGSVVQIARKGGVKVMSSLDKERLEVGVLPSGEKVQVLNVMVQDSENEIYLYVESEGLKGFVYGGRTYPELTVPHWIKVIEE